MRTPARLLLPALALLAAGCGGESQPPFPDLQPVTGAVRQGGRPVKGGAVRFAPDPDNPAFTVNGPVGDDGRFTLSTVRTTDRNGERKPGAPAGQYRVTYLPPAGDQTTGPAAPPVDLPTPVTVEPRETTLTIDLPKK